MIPKFLAAMSPTQIEYKIITNEIIKARKEPPIRFLKNPYSILCRNSIELSRSKFLICETVVTISFLALVSSAISSFNGSVDSGLF